MYGTLWSPSTTTSGVTLGGYKRKKASSDIPSSSSCITTVIDPGLAQRIFIHHIHWEGYRESRRCSRDTYPESYFTKYTSIRSQTRGRLNEPTRCFSQPARRLSGVACHARLQGHLAIRPPPP